MFFKEGLDTADYEGMNMASLLMVPLPVQAKECQPPAENEAGSGFDLYRRTRLRYDSPQDSSHGL